MPVVLLGKWYTYGVYICVMFVYIFYKIQVVRISIGFVNALKMQRIVVRSLFALVSESADITRCIRCVFGCVHVCRENKSMSRVPTRDDSVYAVRGGWFVGVVYLCKRENGSLCPS